MGGIQQWQEKPFKEMSDAEKMTAYQQAITAERTLRKLVADKEGEINALKGHLALLRSRFFKGASALVLCLTLAAPAYALDVQVPKGCDTDVIQTVSTVKTGQDGVIEVQVNIRCQDGREFSAVRDADLDEFPGVTLHPTDTEKATILPKAYAL